MAYTCRLLANLRLRAGWGCHRCSCSECQAGRCYACTAPGGPH